MTVYRMLLLSPVRPFRQLLLERLSIEELFVSWRPLDVAGWTLIGHPEAVTIDEERQAA